LIAKERSKATSMRITDYPIPGGCVVLHGVKSSREIFGRLPKIPTGKKRFRAFSPSAHQGNGKLVRRFLTNFTRFSSCRSRRWRMPTARENRRNFSGFVRLSHSNKPKSRSPAIPRAPLTGHSSQHSPSSCFALRKGDRATDGTEFQKPISHPC